MLRRYKTKIQKHTSYIRSFILLMGGLAAIAYCSWPLGYVLNPKVSAHGLESELGAIGQPYNWLFISGDVIAGVVILTLVFLLWWKLRNYWQPWQRTTIMAFALFGLFTAADALMPMHCVPSLAACPGVSQDKILILHGLVSISAGICLFLTTWFVWRVEHADWRKTLSAMMMVGWVVFGVASVVFFFIPGPGHIAQHDFTLMASIWIILLPSILLSPEYLPKEI